MREDYSPHLQWTAAQAPLLRDELLRLANQNSGSFNPRGVRAVAEMLAPRFSALGASAQWFELPPYQSTADDGTQRERAVGPALRLRLRPEAPLQVFLGGHLDTVYGAEHPFQTARFVDDDTVHGPGVADLKGGLLAMWLALATLERTPWRERVGWEVLLNPDEEIGSTGSAPLLAEAAQRHRFGLIYEPSFPDGSLASSRKGSGNFEILVHGRAAHAGRNPQDGRNAIAAAARVIDAINGLQREGVTINPAYVRGGGPLNVIPDFCLFKFNVRTQQAGDEPWLQGELDRIFRAHGGDGIVFELRGGFTRPPKPLAAAQERLMDWVLDCGRALELPLAFKPTGGCCDGNNLAAHGLPNLDNLGVVGRDIHSDRETMRYSSLGERAQLSALLLMRVASGEWSWT
ncbi:hydrolase [Solimonas variicoloris]|uniref:hydrolase n=1 Tax=Solimonas variicoloris TaxID=254408 RepID=UPI000367DD04|nr:hydrolase [Solimonas variicoloris]